MEWDKACDKACDKDRDSPTISSEVLAVVKDVHGLLDLTHRSSCIPITQSNHRRSPFLKLPTELRNKIYGYVFSDNLIFVRCGRDIELFFWTKSMEDPPHMDLLYTCRSIYAETRLLPLINSTYHERTSLWIVCPNAGLVFPIQLLPALTYIEVCNWALSSTTCVCKGYESVWTEKCRKEAVTAERERVRLVCDAVGASI
ncbi:hypothetical protein BU23DRAFT_571930 [Bimuria novae-zelandiae CBS 107.79]|uniref:Uncharacterized protein n=1 Tax=Bimuria novae-zelandiae CBS 107.79 TaxID=1447943 RepID=A0A6A5V1V5_9PLEO|nr:hypothetical protein BU23DRAFT_571930 [Bimuria novae-zelandiae CBS 107.79]